MIDDYLGNMHMKFCFADKQVGIQITKKAEAFLEEYEGFAVGILIEA